MALSNKHKVFVEEYLKTWNATEAARRAGYAENGIRVTGHRLLTNPNIADEIQNRVAERTMGADEVLVRLSEQARAEHSAYILPNGTVDLAKLIADGKAHLIKRIKITQWGTNVEWHDPHAAKELIGKHHKLFGDKLDVHHTGLGFNADDAAAAEKEINAWREQRNKNGNTSNG